VNKIVLNCPRVTHNTFLESKS